MQIKIIINIDSPDEALVSISISSEQTLFLVTASSLSLSNLSDSDLKLVNISKFMAIKILNKRSGLSGVKYKCKVRRVWLAVNLLKKVSEGRVRIRSYEDRLI